MSIDWLADVHEFQQKFGFTVAEKPTIQKEKCRDFRLRLIEEEHIELKGGLLLDDLTEIADALADLIYVLLGTSVSYGIDLRPIWDEVHRSNMEKTEGNVTGDGTKPLKPVKWRKPAVESLLNMQLTGYDSIAKEYFDSRHKTCRNFDLVTEIALKTLRPHVPSPILETGAGRGCCHKYTGQFATVQIDSSRKMLSLQPREPAVRILADARRLPFHEEDFNSVVGFLCDPYLNMDFLKETHRVLTPAGKLLLTTPSHVWGTALRGGDVHETVFTTKDGCKVIVPSKLFTIDELRSMLQIAGYTILHLKDYKLPREAEPSDAVKKAAKVLNLETYEIPLVTVIFAMK